MYVSPLTERMRKRKAFADSELESNSHLFALSTTPAAVNLSSPYTRLTMPNVPLSMHLSSVIEYNTIQQSMITNESEMVEYLPQITPPPSMDYDYRLNEYSCKESSPNRIRIIDDAKLTNLQRTNKDSHNYSPSTYGASNKPKLSFSIESIIGIK